MTTIPLAAVVSYLHRKDVDLACLEGAPFTCGDLERPRRDWLSAGLLSVLLDPVLTPSNAALYLGRDAVCLAAMGWAAWVLRCDIIVDDRDAVWAWRHGESEPDHAWSWEGDAVEQVEHHHDATWFPGAPPETPAARLRAVLEYEMGRDQ